MQTKKESVLTSVLKNQLCSLTMQAEKVFTSYLFPQVIVLLNKLWLLGAFILESGKVYNIVNNSFVGV